MKKSAVLDAVKKASTKKKLIKLLQDDVFNEDFMENLRQYLEDSIREGALD